LRELMVYQSPPELGALYTEVEAMMQVMGKEQRVLIAKQMEKDRIEKIKKRKRLDRIWLDATIGILCIVVAALISLSLVYVAEDRIKRYPEYGNDWIPRSAEQRRKDSLPKHYIGR